jgi:hypothetical protein
MESGRSDGAVAGRLAAFGRGARGFGAAFAAEAFAAGAFAAGVFAAGALAAGGLAAGTFAAGAGSAATCAADGFAARGLAADFSSWAAGPASAAGGFDDLTGCSGAEGVGADFDRLDGRFFSGIQLRTFNDRRTRRGSRKGEKHTIITPVGPEINGKPHRGACRQLLR